MISEGKTYVGYSNKMIRNALLFVEKNETTLMRAAPEKSRF